MDYTNKTIVLYDGYCLFCKKIKKIINLLDWYHRIDFVNIYDTFEIQRYHINIPSNNDLLKEIHVIGSDKKMYKGFYAVRKICTLLPMAWILSPFLFLPGAARVGTFLYSWLARERHHL